MADAVAIAGISKRYGARTVLDAVSFRVPEGCIFGLLGPNGAGKTTLFSIIAGFVRPDAGQAMVLGHDSRRIERCLGRVGILPQDARFQSDLPIIDQMAFFLRLCGRSREEAATAVALALERVGLGGEMRGSATTLSHGMAKRLGLAQAFLGDPELVLLDEPTAGLDPANAAAIRALVAGCRARNATIVISSHDLAEMQALCDHVCILDRGRVVSVGRVQDIIAEARQAILTLNRPLRDAELLSCAALPGIAAITPLEGLVYRIAFTAGTGAGDAAMAALLGTLLELGVVPRRLEPGNALERHFLDRTRGQEAGMA